MLGPAVLAHLLVAIALLLFAAHACGTLFRKLRQPQVIGEIAGGLLLGPTVLGGLWPEGPRALFHAVPSTEHVLAALYQLGLLLLMFCSGLEVRTRFEAGEKRVALGLTLAGIALPFALTLGLAGLFAPESHLGEAGNRSAWVLVLAIAVAVTSIPVISRVLFDLGVLDTSFARIVLAAAVLEDTVLYVLLALALALVAAPAEVAFGLPGQLGLHGASAAALGYHVVASLAFFAGALLVGPRLFERARRVRLLRENNPVAALLLLLLVFSAAALALGVPAFLGAFAAGLTANRVDDPSGARETIKRFSLAFPIPLYFAMVGLRLDLVRHFPVLWFLGFFAYASAVKLASCYAGARLAKEPPAAAFNLAVAMNARGGPGIVLASVALDARIIDQPLYVALVMLAIVTSCLAGAWLGSRVRRGQPLR